MSFASAFSRLSPFAALMQAMPCKAYRWLVMHFWIFLAMALLMPSHFIYIWWFYLAVCLPLIVVIYYHWQRIREGLSQPLGMQLLALVGYTLLHAVLLTEGQVGLMDTIRHSLINSMFLLAGLLVFSLPERALLPLLRSFVPIVAVMAAASILWHIGAVGLEQRLEPLGKYDHAILGGNIYSVFMLMGFLWLHPASQSNRNIQIMVMCAVALVLIMLILTGSRGALLSFLLAGGAGLLLTGYRRICLIMALGGLAIGADLLIHYLYHDSFLPLHSFYDVVITMWDRESHRITIWSIASEMIAERPLTGYGMRASFPYGFGGVNPHNLFISAWYYVGIAGFMLLLAITLTALWQAWQMRRSPYGCLCVVLMIHALAACFTDQGQFLKSPSALWLIYWLPVCMVWGRITASKNNATSQNYLVNSA